MRRREFIKVIVGSAGWPLAVHAQTSDKPAIGFLSARSAKVCHSTIKPEPKSMN